MQYQDWCLPERRTLDRRSGPGSMHAFVNLLDALRALEASPVLRKGLGEPFISAYLKLKHADWNEYAGHLTEWERRNTLDC